MDEVAGSMLLVSLMLLWFKTCMRQEESEVPDRSYQSKVTVTIFIRLPENLKPLLSLLRKKKLS